MIGWRESGLGVAVAVAVVLLTIGLHPVIVKIRRRGNKPRSGTLEILSNPDDAKFEIVAVHDLGADPDHTWTHSRPADSVDRSQEPEAAKQGPAHCPRRIHLLRDLLCRDFPQARILSFAHNSRWLTDAPVKTTEEIGKSLLGEIRAKRSQRHLPIIFIGHSLGGIIIKQALCRKDSEEIINDTSGIIFLGTPHQGSPVSVAGAVLALVTGFLGSDPTLLLSLRSHGDQLSNLADTFRSRTAPNEYRRQKVPIVSFYETKPMYLLGWLSLGLVVSRDSAVVHADEEHSIDTDHSGLNKCAGSEDQLYIQLKKAIDSLRAPSLLEQADTLIRNEHYTEDKLRIVRLSRMELPMDQCYINLAIVEKSGQVAGREKEQDAASSRHSLFARQKVETPNKTIQVKLPAIFNQHKADDGRAIQPRRILIRGQAGVGKTTLCKKMVYDFTRGTQTELNRLWTKLFDRLLWVPLRNLKGRSATGYNHEDLFYQEYFAAQGHDDGRVLAKGLWRELKVTSSGRTLFILDGLDEVSHDLDRNDDMSRFLIDLLRQPNVIITSRPNANLPSGVRDLDLELETIGFYPNQVDAYLEADPKIKPRANEVRSFLQDHWLMQGLMRIPIQLDALCYTWDDFDFGTTPDTMTGIYRAIELKLWKKDAVRLEKMPESHVRSARPAEIVGSIKTETSLLECLAFNGLHSDIIDFKPTHRDDIVELFRLQLPLDDTLARLSFLRTSEPSLRPEDRNYHFIHLTFQEYFAARYFVRKWKDHKQLEYIFKRQQDRHSNSLMDPVKFLQRHKYSARYDVFWRFVTGLLDVERDDKILDFFNAIEGEPLDLLGPAHQRLVMHCLSEVSREIPIRTDLERRLSEWLLFEYNFRGTVYLAWEMECPDQVLGAAFREGSDEMKRKITESVRATVPSSILEQAHSWLENEEPGVRGAAVQGLGGRLGLPDKTLKAVAARLEDEHQDIRWATVQALASRLALADEILKAVAARLEDKDQDVQRAAIQALASRSALPDEILKAVAARLEDKDKDVRRTAAQALASRSALPDEILEAVAARLKDEHQDVRRDAIRALASRSALPNEILEAVAARLKDEHQDVRRDAIRALASRLNLPDEILKAVAARLEDEDRDVRWTAIEALGSRLALPDDILETIAVRLEDECQDVRSAAIGALGSQPALPDKILKTIVARLEDKYRDIRWATIEVLSSRPALPDKILKTIAARLEDEDRSVRRATVKALGSRSALPNEILKAMAARLEDEDWCVQQAAIRALGSQSALPDEILKAIAARLDDKIRDIQRAAVRALASRSALPNEILTAVVARLEDEHHNVREDIVEALNSRSLALPDEILKAIAARLKDEDWGVRWHAVRCLASRSALPEEILKAIAARLEDEHRLVREDAETTLRRHRDFYRALLHSPYVVSLYRILLRRSFAEQFSWYIEDGNFCVNTPEDIRNVSISGHGNYVKAMVNARPANFPQISSQSRTAMQTASS